MKKKIGILTLYYHSYNYGGLLQSYALQKYTENLGYESKQISYVLESGYNFSTKKKIKRYIKKTLLKIKDIKYIFKTKRREKRFNSFGELIPHTKVVKAQTIKELNNEFDIFICGSDQIWNPIGWQPTLMLSFANDDKKLISYSASIAKSKLNDNELEFLTKHIKRFNYISIREKNNIEELEKSLNKKVYVMPDPTLLISQKEWKAIAKEPEIFKKKDFKKKKYILNYFLNEKSIENEAMKEINRIAKEKDCKIINIFHKNDPFYECGPKEFLWLEENAFLICTDSFHSSVFAIIFNTPFIVFKRFQKNKENNMNSRIDTLLGKFDIENRLFNGKITNDLLKVDYKQKEKTIEKEKEKAFSFFKEAIE